MTTQDNAYPTMEARELAALLGWTPETFSKHKKRLIAEEGMPMPLPSRLYWRASVMRWLDTYADRKAEAAARMEEKSFASLRVNGDRAKLEAKYVARNAA